MRYYSRNFCNMPNATSPPSFPNGESALRAVQSQGRYIFRASEFAELTGRDPNGATLRLALARLSQKREIVSLVKRPSTWLIVPPEQLSYGAPPVTWWLDEFLRDADGGYYLGLLSAARYWGSSHYARQTTQVVVGKKRAPLKVGRLGIDFTFKAAASQTPTHVAMGGVARYRVSSREATLLDLLRHSKENGGLEAITRVARDFAPDMTEAGIVEALSAMNQTAVAQRLGFLLSQLGTKLQKPVANWLATRKTRSEPLEYSPGQSEEVLLRDSQWRIEFTPRQLDLIKELA
jgi:predicted transcriptional regulator of viral defense system